MASNCSAVRLRFGIRVLVFFIELLFVRTAWSGADYSDGGAAVGDDDGVKAPPDRANHREARLPGDNPDSDLNTLGVPELLRLHKIHAVLDLVAGAFGLIELKGHEFTLVCAPQKSSGNTFKVSFKYHFNIHPRFFCVFLTVFSLKAFPSNPCPFRHIFSPLQPIGLFTLIKQGNKRALLKRFSSQQNPTPPMKKTILALALAAGLTSFAGSAKAITHYR